MRLLYIAGPYTALSPWEIETNVRTAEMAAISIMRCYQDVFCYVPHCNTRWMGCIDEDQAIKGNLEMMTSCDAVFVVGSHESTGTRREVDLATSLGIPVLRSLGDLEQFVGQ